MFAGRRQRRVLHSSARHFYWSCCSGSVFFFFFLGLLSSSGGKKREEILFISANYKLDFKEGLSKIKKFSFYGFNSTDLTYRKRRCKWSKITKVVFPKTYPSDGKQDEIFCLIIVWYIFVNRQWSQQALVCGYLRSRSSKHTRKCEICSLWMRT